VWCYLFGLVVCLLFFKVPLGFVSEQATTFEFQGTEQVRIGEPGNGALSKRQATMQLCFSPAAEVQPRAAIIFRGKGLRISPVERKSWDARVDVYFNEKAWANRQFCEDWANKTFGPAVKHNPCAKLLFADNLDGQLFAGFKTACKANNVLVWYLLANCTDVLQPVDAGYGRDVKREVAAQMNLWLEDDGNLESWENNELTASQRRILMTQWVFVAV
jgi:hypothetical protein